MTDVLIVFIPSFVLMAFFAGSEMAFLSCNKLKLKHLADSGSRAAKIVARFQNEPKRIITTILIGTNLAHVSLASIFTYALETQCGITQEWIVTLLLAPFVIIFAETVPKDWFRQKADDMIYRIAPVLLFFERLFRPFAKVILAVTDYMLGFMQPETKRSPFVTKDEFRMILDESARGGVLKEHEKQLIHTILDLGSVTAGEMMVSLKQFPTLELSGKVRDAKEIARRSKKPIILIYEEIPSIVVGVVYVFDLLFEENEDSSLAKFLRPPLFIPHDLSVEKTIYQLQSKRSSYAVVTNQNLEVVGVVAIENLIRF